MTAKVLGLRLSYLRPALYAIVALDVIALALFAVRVDTVTKTTTTPAAQVVSTSPTLPVAPPVPVPPAVPPAPPLLAGGGTTITVPVDKPTKPAAPTTPAEPAPTPTEPSARIARCLIPIKEPTTSGGLQSLISFAPVFGPFKAEAFAAASAYQPVLQLLGPILAKYPEIAPKIEPAMTPFIQAFAGVLDQGFALIEPFYAPHRQAVLEAEGKLAAALAPYAQKLLTSPLGGCIVELQAVLLEDSTPKKG